MKTLCLILLFAASALALDRPATARLYRDHFACAREAWLKDTFEFGQKGDRKSMASYLAMRRCFRTLDSTVYLLTLKSVEEPKGETEIQSGGESGIVATQILVGGRKMWVHSAALRLEN